jgi:hypothetical protein
MASRVSHRTPVALALLAGVMIVEFADISGDYPYLMGRPYKEWLPELRGYTALASSLLVAGLVVIAAGRVLLRRRLVMSPRVQAFLLLFFASTILGALVGFARGNVPVYVLGDSRNAIVYLALLAVPVLPPDRVLLFVRRAFYGACAIVLLKLALSVATGLALGLGVSWRYLFKASYFLPPMALLSLALFQRATTRAGRRWYLRAFALGALGVLTAQMRGFFLGLGAGLMVLATWTGNLRRVVRMGGALLLMLVTALALALLVQGDLTKTFGYWSFEDFQAGLDYRSRQFDFLFEGFRSHWLLGTGLGWFDPRYEGFADFLTRPYLQELEYMNLLTKLGLVGFSLLLLSFVCLFYECLLTRRMAATPQHRAMVEGFSAGLVSMLTASISNTGYSMMLFHVYVVLLLLVLGAVRRAALAPLRTVPQRGHNAAGLTRACA